MLLAALDERVDAEALDDGPAQRRPPPTTHCHGRSAAHDGRGN